MKKLLLILLLPISMQISAGDYQSVYSNSDELFFKSNTSNFDKIEWNRIQSMQIKNQDSTLIFVSVKKKYWESRCVNDILCYFGDSVIIKKNGDEIFYSSNKQMLLKPYESVGKTWVSSQLNTGNYWEASVKSIDVEKILGITDSVKTIEFHMRNSSGNIISKLKYFIQIGKNIGIIRTQGYLNDHYLMENTLTGAKSIELLGSKKYSVGKWPLFSKNMIYDYQKGDTIETTYSYSKINYYPPFDSKKEIIQYIVQDIKEVNENIEATIKINGIRTSSSSEPEKYQYVVVKKIKKEVGFDIFYWMKEDESKTNYSYNKLHDLSYLRLDMGYCVQNPFSINFEYVMMGDYSSFTQGTGVIVQNTLKLQAGYYEPSSDFSISFYRKKTGIVIGTKSTKLDTEIEEPVKDYTKNIDINLIQEKETDEWYISNPVIQWASIQFHKEDIEGVLLFYNNEGRLVARSKINTNDFTTPLSEFSGQQLLVVPISNNGEKLSPKRIFVQ